MGFGARAEIAVATALMRAGKRVYLPFFGADSGSTGRGTTC